jgi:hypothetical protein
MIKITIDLVAKLVLKKTGNENLEIHIKDLGEIGLNYIIAVIDNSSNLLIINECMLDKEIEEKDGINILFMN